MRDFFQRISSRKFLAALAAQLAGVLALFWPAHEQTFVTAAVRIAALATMLLAALGYGSIEATVDRAAATSDPAPAPGPTGPTVQTKTY